MPQACRQRIRRFGQAVWIASAALLGVPCFVTAQQAAPPPAPSSGGRDIPSPDQLEPSVSTTPAPQATPAPPAAPAAQAAPATAADPATPVVPAPAAGGAARSGAPASAKPASAPQSASTAKAAPRKGPDRLELDATDITGNRELPKVLYIVPWKRSDLGDVSGEAREQPAG